MWIIQQIGPILMEMDAIGMPVAPIVLTLEICSGIWVSQPMKLAASVVVAQPSKQQHLRHHNQHQIQQRSQQRPTKMTLGWIIPLAGMIHLEMIAPGIQKRRIDAPTWAQAVIVNIKGFFPKMHAVCVVADFHHRLFFHFFLGRDGTAALLTVLVVNARAPVPMIQSALATSFVLRHNKEHRMCLDVPMTRIGQPSLEADIVIVLQ